MSPRELSEVAVAQHRRNVSQCWDGYSNCDRSKLSAAELEAVKVADHHRDYLACMSGFAGCDRSRLTLAEVDAIRSAEQTGSTVRIPSRTPLVSSRKPYGFTSNVNEDMACCPYRGQCYILRNEVAFRTLSLMQG